MKSTENLEVVEYRIDSGLIITFVSENWSVFARENGANDLTAENTIGKHLKEFITDNETFELYINIIDKVRNTGEGISFPFRCDSPDYRRFMEMEVVPYSINEIQFKCVLVKKERRAKQQFLSPNTDRSDDFLTICSWCKKIKTREKCWLEIEDAVRALKLMDSVKLPKLTHGVCPECFHIVKRIINDSHKKRLSFGD